MCIFGGANLQNVRCPPKSSVSLSERQKCGGKKIIKDEGGKLFVKWLHKNEHQPILERDNIKKRSDTIVTVVTLR